MPRKGTSKAEKSVKTFPGAVPRHTQTMIFVEYQRINLNGELRFAITPEVLNTIRETWLSQGGGYGWQEHCTGTAECQTAGTPERTMVAGAGAIG